MNFGSIAKRGSAAATLIAVLGHAAAARADWQYTKWGMSPEQVRAASGGTAAPNSNRGLDAGADRALLVGSYRSGDFQFRTSFRFDPGNRLVFVELDLTDLSKCPLLVYQMNNAYRTPASQSKDAITQFMKWFDQENGNAVIYYEINTKSCSVRYSPLAVSLR